VAALAKVEAASEGTRPLIDMTIVPQVLRTATGPHALPPLPYAMDGLAPVISARTLSFHREHHHQGYVDALNRGVAYTPYADMSLEQLLKATVNQVDLLRVFNNAAQVWNHNFYWQSLRPHGGGEPPQAIKTLIEFCFGSMEGFRSAIAAAAANRLGSGWVWLVLEAGQLKVLDTGNAERPATGQHPLLVIDVWEHAYYLDYQNRRAEHVTAVITKLLNWRFAADNLR
jgi:superoxide dismutase, Fe-Mn family